MILQMCILFGTLMGISVVWVIAVDPTDATCVIPIWLGHIAFWIVFSCLFVKTFRVWWIFNAVQSKMEYAPGCLHADLLSDTPLLPTYKFLVLLLSLYLPYLFTLRSGLALVALRLLAYLTPFTLKLFASRSATMIIPGIL